MPSQNVGVSTAATIVINQTVITTVSSQVVVPVDKVRTYATFGSMETDSDIKGTNTPVVITDTPTGPQNPGSTPSISTNSSLKADGGSSSQSLSPSAIGGIVGGIVGGLIILGLFLAWFIRRTISARIVAVAPPQPPPVYQETTASGERLPVQAPTSRTHEPCEEIERPVGGRLQGIPEGVDEDRPGGRVAGLHY